MRTVAIINQKGGCGKTTTSINLAACLASLGHKTLLVDMDPQGHCGVGLAVPEEQIERTIYEALIEPSDGKTADITQIVWQIASDFDLAPSNIRLAAFEQVFAHRAGRDERLKAALEKVRNNYQWCVIDCPPSVGLITFNALKASDQVIVPVETGYFSLHGLAKMMETLEVLRNRCGRDVLIRILPTLYDTRTKLAREVLSELRSRFKNYLMESTVNFNTKLKEAASFGQPITEYDPGSRGYKDFANLARELMGHDIAENKAAMTVEQGLSRPAELVQRAKQLQQLANAQFGRPMTPAVHAPPPKVPAAAPIIPAPKPAVPAPAPAVSLSAPKPTITPAAPAVSQAKPAIPVTPATIPAVRPATPVAAPATPAAATIAPPPLPAVKKPAQTEPAIVAKAATSAPTPIAFSSIASAPRSSPAPAAPARMSIGDASVVEPLMRLTAGAWPPPAETLLPKELASPLSLADDEESILDASQADRQPIPPFETIAKIPPTLNAFMISPPQAFAPPEQKTTQQKIEEFYGVKQIGAQVIFAAHFDQAKSVLIAGDFNNWTPQSTPMVNGLRPGDWRRSLPLAPGRYKYRLVVDGKWTTDPNNKYVEVNQFGEFDNVIEVERAAALGSRNSSSLAA